MKTIYVVISVLRQESGTGAAAIMDTIGIKIEKAFADRDKASEFLNGLPQTDNVQTPQGIIQCVPERGVQPVELEE